MGLCHHIYFGKFYYMPVKAGTLAEIVQPAAPIAAGSYTVKKGDTYGTIALNNYGTYGVRSYLRAQRRPSVNANTIFEGQGIVLPEK